jgi:very-short-patch-repair endonuclease
LRFWEHEVKTDPRQVVENIVAAVESRLKHRSRRV